MRKTVALACSIAILASAAPAFGSSQLVLNGSKATASLNFSIRIPPLLRLRTLDAAAAVELPASGAQVVEVQDAARFEVQSNLRAGHELRFEIHDPDVEAVDIAGLDQPVKVTRAGQSVRFWRSTAPDATRRHVLRYTIRYAPGARPGPRPMPVGYSVSVGA